MKPLILTSFLLLLALKTQAQKSIEGVWQTGKDNTIIHVQNIQNEWNGKVVSSDNENASPGKLVIRNMVWNGEIWEGEFYVPPLDSWLDATMEPEGNQAEVTVYVGWFSKSLTWVKME